MKKLYYDTETTGLKHDVNGIHQIAGYIEIDGEVKEYFNFNIAPFPADVIEDSALAVSGITREDLKNYLPPVEAHKRFTQMLGRYCDKMNKKDKFFLAGYNNIHFDNQFLRSWFTKCGDKWFGSWFFSNTIDVMVLATQKLLEQRSGMENFQLKTVAKELGIVIDETKLHDASYDIDLTREIYRRCTI